MYPSASLWTLSTRQYSAHMFLLLHDRLGKKYRKTVSVCALGGGREKRRWSNGHSNNELLLYVLSVSQSWIRTPPCTTSPLLSAQSEAWRHNLRGVFDQSAPSAPFQNRTAFVSQQLRQRNISQLSYLKTFHPLCHLDLNITRPLNDSGARTASRPGQIDSEGHLKTTGVDQSAVHIKSPGIHLKKKRRKTL